MQNHRSLPGTWLANAPPVFRSSRALSGAILALLIVAVPYSHAQNEVVIHTFTGGTDGANPYAGLVLDSRGNLYGTTVNGGGSTSCSGGCGTVFKVTSSGKESILYSFAGGTDGANPYGGLIRDARGNLYGTTVYGGSYVGTVFEVTAGGAETLLHVFGSSSTGDGSVPFAGLLADPKGNLYGTTFSGGSQCTTGGGCGTVFQVAPAGIETVLYSFAGGTDGSFPFCSLAWDTDGNLYGTTVFGGTYDQGAVFRVSLSGTETVLYSFTGGDDGGQPAAGLVRDPKGNLFGTTQKGGAFGNGTVFRITPTGLERVYYSFQGGADGELPSSPLILDSKGNLYGTTYQGGAPGFGTVFQISADGTERVLYSFAGGTDGAGPVGGLVRDLKGNLYGTTYQGGTTGYGTVFKVTP
jgi:uncharacterized repeat protein (TIGR03803 family)